MFFITFSNLWSFSYFIVMLYIIFIFSLVVYFVPIQSKYSSSSSASFYKSNFTYINLNDTIQLIVSPVFVFFMLNLLWSSPTITAWFGHIIFSSFSQKSFFLISFVFLIILYVYSSSSYLTSQEFSDYLSVIYSFYFWVSVLYFTNSIFTLIFGIEVLSTLIFLLIITSSYSSNYYYNNLDLSSFNYKNYAFPFSTLQSILFFFWISLIASLSLFLFLLFFYIKLLTFDWFLVEYIFLYFVETKSLVDINSLGLVWFIFLLCIFIKCGLTPFYIWKPTFFKGLYTNVLFFYICFYYMFLFLFIINMLVVYFHAIFYYFVFVQVVLLFVGLFFLLFILCETFYLKSFLAISSILNSVLVLLALASNHSLDSLLWW